MRKLIASAVIVLGFATGANAINQIDLENAAFALLYDRDCLVFPGDSKLTADAKLWLEQLTKLFSETERQAARETIMTKYVRDKQRYEFCYAGQRQQIDEYIIKLNAWVPPKP